MSIHAGHRRRVKDEFNARGLEGWPDHRILELLLFFAIPQGDLNGLAHDLVDRFGSLAGVLDYAGTTEEMAKKQQQEAEAQNAADGENDTDAQAEEET